MSYRFFQILVVFSFFSTWMVNKEEVLSQQIFPVDAVLPTSAGMYARPFMRDTFLCEGSCLTLGNQSLCEEGILTYLDADSMEVSWTVKIIQPESQEEAVDICFGKCFKTYCTAGEFTETIKSIGGCDSVYMTYKIKALPEIEVTVLPTIFLCPGECYENPSLGGPVRVCNTETTLAGAWQASPILAAVNGCDSMVSIDLFFEKDPMLSIDALVCNGATYVIGKDSLRTEGVYPIRLKSSRGCDSTVIVTLSDGEHARRDTTIRLCEGSFFEVDGVPQYSGETTREYVSQSGCDSVVHYIFEVADSIVIDTSLSLCIGDTFRIGSLAFAESAKQMFRIPSSVAVCDSFISVDITFLDCSLEATTVADSVKCSDDLTGRFSFSITKGFGPFTYQWNYLDSLVIGPSVELNEAINVDGLPQGDYQISITDAVGNEEIFDITITGPDYWAHEWEYSEYSGYTVRCNGGKDGELRVLPKGGVPPYSYEWNSGETTQKITDLVAGSYAVTITDVLNCRYIIQYDATEPPLLQIEIDSIKPSCDSFATGVISVVAEQGGVPPYDYAIAGVEPIARGRFEGLLPGNYELIALDENGCQRIFETYLPAPDIPALDFESQLYVSLADPIELGVLSNVPLATIEWSEEEGLDCYSCLSPIATPISSTTYSLTAISNDGCKTTERITVNIAKERDVFVPNAFSPNGDGLNDRLTIFGGPEVAQIRMVRIFSRWGELVFEQTNFLPNDEFNGWDGRLQGKKVIAGSYIWIAKIDFIDGVTLDYTGDITIK